jgi:hypothetical protein
MTVAKVAVFALNFVPRKCWNYPAGPIPRDIILPG